MEQPTIGWSNFARTRHAQDSGNSYTNLDEAVVVQRVLENWDRRKPGTGETTTDRKVLVPIPADGFFCPPKAKLVAGMPVQAEVVVRQEGEDPFVQTFITPEDARQFGAVVEMPAHFVEVVVYSADALLENGGERSTDCDWEIVCLLAQQGFKTEPMPPLTMARNQLEKPGGTKGEYTGQQYAEAIWFHANRGVMIRKRQQ